jgi:23S rRNA pseudouridine1911/1915/1917 synthase
MPTSQIVERPAELLAYLFASRVEMKRAKLRQWLKHGSIHVNGRSITRFDHAMQIGDVVSIRTKKEVLTNALLPPALKVLFEDLSLIVIVKPESLLSMASETERHKTAYALLTDYVRRGNRRTHYSNTELLQSCDRARSHEATFMNDGSYLSGMSKCG